MQNVPKVSLSKFSEITTTGTPTGVARCPHAAALLQRWRGGSDAAAVLRASHRSALAAAVYNGCIQIACLLPSEC